MTRRAGVSRAEFGARGGYDPGHADARPWLYRIARNVLRAHWRARREPIRAAAGQPADPWVRRWTAWSYPVAPGPASR